MQGFETSRREERLRWWRRKQRWWWPVKTGDATGAAKRSSSRPDGALVVPPASRKEMLVRLALELWRDGRLAAAAVPETRGREISDEAQMTRALMRSTTYQLEAVLREPLKSVPVVVEGKLGGATRQKLEKIGVELHEEHDPEERWYIDMTPAVFASAGIIMALRYISLGLGDRAMYVFAGVSFAAFFAARPFLYKMMRPRDG